MLARVLRQSIAAARAVIGSAFIRAGCKLIGLEEDGEFAPWPLDDETLDEDESAILPGVTLSDWAKNAVARGSKPTTKRTNGAPTKPLTGSLADRIARARRTG